MKTAKRILTPIVCLVFATVTGCSSITVPRPNVTHIAFGDSATNGPADTNYHEFLAQMIGISRFDVGNEGVGGETSAEGRQRLSELLESDQYPNAEVLLYWQGGVNVTRFIREFDSFLTDSPLDEDYEFTAELNEMFDQLQDDLETGITRARERNLTVYVATYFPLYNGTLECDTLPLNLQFSLQYANGQAYIDLLNERIRTAAENAGAILVDVAADARIGTDRDQYDDCNHMSDEGNELVAENFRDVLQAQP